jgi:hypothetical protein
MQFRFAAGKSAQSDSEKLQSRQCAVTVTCPPDRTGTAITTIVSSVLARLLRAASNTSFLFAHKHYFIFEYLTENIVQLTVWET